MRGSGSLPGVAGWVIVALLLAVPVVATVHVLESGPELRAMPIGVAGPPLVAQPVADRIDSLPARPFDAVVLASGAGADEPARFVADGEVEAVVVLDLRDEEDRLLVRSTLPPAVIDEIVVTAEAVGDSYGRTVVVERVEPSRSAGVGGRLPLVLVAACALAGAVAAVGVSAWRGGVGAVASVRPRVLGLGVVALPVGLLAGAVAGVLSDASWLAVAPVGAATCTATAWLALALEELWGLPGIAVGAAFLAGLAVPLIVGVEPTTMPAPWAGLHALSPHDAARRLVGDAVFGGGDGAIEPWLLIAAWAVVGLFTVLVAERLRPDVPGSDARPG